MPSNTRNLSIDLVKIIAMIMVVRMHIGLNHNLEHFAPFSFIHGIISPAVPLFFMVSGYLMQSKMPDYKYVWRKILGILKYVYIIIPIACVFTGIFEHHPRPHSLYLWIIGGGNLWQFWYFAAIILVYVCACINTKLSDSKIIKELSALFLLVYTLHPLAIQLYGKYLHIDCVQQFSGTICFVIVLIATFGISWLLMRMPYVKNIFRI